MLASVLHIFQTLGVIEETIEVQVERLITQFERLRIDRDTTDDSFPHEGGASAFVSQLI